MSGEEVIALCISGLMLVGLVAIVGGFLHVRRERLLLHAERMRALELGREMPEDKAITRAKAMTTALADPPEPDPDRALARKSYSTALWVSFWGFMFASGSAAATSTPIATIIAGGAGATALAAVIGGTVLAYRAASATKSTADSLKPSYEPDAYDVVGARSRAS
jgi:hypothetical protein